MASCQEGQACTVAGTAQSKDSTTNIHFTALFFLTIFLLLLFYVSRVILGAGGQARKSLISGIRFSYRVGFSGRETTSRIPLAFRARRMIPMAPETPGLSTANTNGTA